MGFVKKTVKSVKKVGRKIDKHVTRPARDIAVSTILGTPSQHMSDKRRKEHEAEMKRIEMEDREERQRRGLGHFSILLKTFFSK